MTNFDFEITKMNQFDVVMTPSNTFLWMDAHGKLNYSNVKHDTLDKLSYCVWTFESNLQSAGLHNHWLEPMVEYELEGKSVYTYVRDLGTATTAEEADKVVRQFIETTPELSFYEIGVVLTMANRAAAQKV